MNLRSATTGAAAGSMALHGRSTAGAFRGKSSPASIEQNMDR